MPLTISLDSLGAQAKVHLTWKRSGFIGNPETKVPGRGLIDRGDNATFVQKTIEGLSGRGSDPMI